MILVSTIYQECLAAYHTTCLSELQQHTHIEGTGHYTHHLVVDEEYWHAQTESFRKTTISYLFGFVNGWERCQAHTLLTPEISNEAPSFPVEPPPDPVSLSLWEYVASFFRRS